ncbi:MAG TPA: DUF1501 domain-containing protein [Gemmataceae bacterium]|nr:DUF1501 domain-containing protein [Gemmataceae bacterium]
MTRLTRRGFLGSGVAGTLGLALSPGLHRLLGADERARRAKACILLWLNGGPSHIDTFDPKPGAATGGPFKAIETKAPGVRLCEHLPNLADQAHRLTVVRSLTSPEGDHDRAFRFVHTGNVPQDVLRYPGLGSVMARERARAGDDFPAAVSIQGPSEGPGFLGVDFAPLVVGDPAGGLDNVGLPDGFDEARLERRLKAVGRLNDGFGKRTDPDRAAEQGRLTERAARFRRSPVLKAFDLSGEKPAMLDAYRVKLEVKEGEEAPPAFGRACLVARRLVAQGVRFVEVMLDGWDTHADNFNQVGTLLKTLDSPFAALVADLADRGMLDETLVICMGEFGRTPVINPSNGRDHHADAFSAVLAGGGVRGGQVIGASDADGASVKDRAVTIPDLYASLLTACGLDPTKSYRTPDGRPVKLVEKGSVVRELFA